MPTAPRVLLRVVPALFLALAPATQPLAQTSADEIVAARKGLKEQIALMMTKIEEPAGNGGAATLEDRQGYASAIGAILAAFPHLFPAETSPDALAAAGSGAQTSAAPAVWEDPEAFHAMALSTADLAREVAQAATETDSIAAAATLRSSCTACHDTYLQWQMTFPVEDGGDLLDALGF